MTFNSFAQKAALLSADKKYEKYAYIDAISTYERIAEKGYKSIEMFQKLGNAYYFNANLEKAAKWYDELFAMTQDLDPEYYYRYAQALKSIGKYEKADEMLIKFNEKSGNDSRGKLFNNKRDYLAEIRANSGRYNIEDAGINSKYSDYGSSYSGNKLIFTSAIDTVNFSKKKDKWTNQYFTNMYSSEIGSDMVLAAPKKFATKINTRFHEASPVFTKDGNTMYFTRNNYNNGEKGKDADRTTLLKIYKATLVNNEWQNAVELPFDNDSYSVAHPSLSADEKTLYFASDMPGTMGQSDIFMVKINDDGTFGTPQNLGSNVNTEGKETFPFVTNENELYFSSDGRPGLGGLDIYMSKIAKDGSYNEAQNIGEPANSQKDDFAYLIDTKTRNGVLTSNRDGGKGFDDIYKFLETRKLLCEQALSGVITDFDTKEILPNSKVSLLDDKFKLIKEVFSDDKAYYEFEVNCDSTYYVRAEKDLYDTKEQKITISKITGKTDLPIALEKKLKPVTVGDDLAKAFGIKMIYFDLDKSNIREDAAYELEKILDVLVKYPTMKIDVRSHTDSRASFEYNDALSDRRAKSTMDWLIKNGVEKDRLSGKGYGERELVNNCADDVDCTEAQHQENRRSQFIIKAL